MSLVEASKNWRRLRTYVRPPSIALQLTSGVRVVARLRARHLHFHEAASVLDDPLSTTFPDPLHSRLERGFVSIGVSSKQRVLVVSHTDEGDVVRIINARRATRSERSFYEEG